MDLHAILIRLLIGPMWARWEGSRYLVDYRSLCRAQYDDPAIVKARQWQAVKAMLEHAYATVPYYNRRLQETSIQPRDIQNFEDYRRVPVLTKNDIRTNANTMICTQFNQSSLHRKTTSGSTGVPLHIWIDEPALQWKRACTLRTDEWSGWQFGEPVALLWGDPEYLKRGWRGRLRNAVLERARYLDTLKIQETSLADFATTLERRQPSLLLGHAHSIYLFAEYLRSKGRKSIRPKGIIATAMVLHGWQRQLIEEVFGRTVTNRYGCEEVSLIASECERHNGLHINADGVFIEIERDGKCVEPGEFGSVIVTDLSNRAMPILRYQIGDVALASNRRCPCGRGYPLLERVDGREADYVVTAAGTLISGISLTDHFGAQIPGAAQVQIIQESIDLFRFRIVRDPDFGPTSIDRLRELVAERFGLGVSYECEYVERILPEPSGKYRFCKSKVKNPFATAQTEAIS